MNNKKYDVIIPVGQNDVNFVPRVIDYLERCLSDFDYVYVITNIKYVAKINKAIQHFSFCKVVDENELIPNLSFARVYNLILQKSSHSVSLTGWYFQQFLKLGFSRSSFCKDYYLSWDADTLPLAPIKFFEDKHILYNPKHENHQNYFDTIHCLLGFGKQVENSFISESMMFSTFVVKEMLSRMEASTIKGDDWVEKIINACDFHKSPLAFSEFETFGNYSVKYYPDLYKPRHLNTFREAGLIRGRRITEKQLRKMSFDVDMASFEMLDMPCFPYNIPNILYKCRIMIRKIRRKTLIQIINKIIGKRNFEESKSVVDFYRLPQK